MTVLCRVAPCHVPLHHVGVRSSSQPHTRSRPLHASEATLFVQYNRPDGRDHGAGGGVASVEWRGNRCAVGGGDGRGQEASYDSALRTSAVISR